jgi:membrane fusion protein, peptide pheromone/bacteriocin exporter
MEIIPFSISTYTLESYLTKINSSSKIIYWIILGTAIFALGVLPFIYVDVTVLSRGYFQPDIEKQVITAPFSGKVIYSSVRNGKKVSKGDTLIIIDSETIRAQKESLRLRINENNTSVQDLRKLTQIESGEDSLLKGKLMAPRYISEYANFGKQHFIQFQKYQKTSIEHERNKLLHRQDIIPDAEYENSLFAFNGEKETLNQIIINQKTIWQSDLVLRINDSVRLMAEYRQYLEQLSDRVVIAPLPGEIIQSSDIQVGSIIAYNQMVVEISPDGELLATCFVKPADIGMIIENQLVIIQVDAFNYNEWGMLKGNVIDISDDMIVENNSAAFFRVRCKLNTKSLALKNGYTVEMKKGMSLNARFLITRRSLFNLLFDKADKWFNPYMNPERQLADAN